MSGAHADIKVLDFCWAVAGPMVGRAFADYGATVVRIESGKRLDVTRIMGPFPDGDRDIQQSVLFDNCNAGKYGITLDMNRPEGIAVARDLVRWADIVVESFAPGQMAKWNLDYASLSEGRADLIMLSTSLLGQSGPYARFAGFGNIGSAFAGFQALAGESHKTPIGPFGPYTDYIGPKFGIIAVLAALEQRRTSGKGCWIDLSQVEAAVQLLAPQVAESSVTGRVSESDGNRDPQFAPHGVFRCRGHDEWIAIVIRNDKEWRSLATVIGGDELVDDPRFRMLEGRKRFEDDLEALVAAFTAGRDVAQLEADLLSMGVPAHQVASSKSFCADPQIRSRGHLRQLVHPLMGEVVIEGSRFELSETPAAIPRCAPTLGQDNDYVLRHFAGYDATKIAMLAAAGILQ